MLFLSVPITMGVVTDSDARSQIRRQVAAEMSRKGWSDVDLAREADIDPGTVSDFLSGARWPIRRNRARIETALGMGAGAFEQIADGVYRRVVTPDQEAGVLLDLPAELLEGLPPVAQEEVRAAGRLAMLAKAREIRGSM